MCITFRPCSEPDLPGIYWRDDDQWRPYDRATSRAILKAASLGLSNVSLGIFTSNVYPSGATYTLNLQSLQQRNSSSGQQRPVLIIPKLTLTQLRAAVMTPSVVWSRIIDAFTTQAYVQHVVNQRAQKCNVVVQQVRRNPYLTPGSPLITRFLAKAQSLPADSALVKGLTYMDTAEGGNLDFAFHGTRSSSFDPILRNGMCPTKRSSSPLGDWFTRQLASAAQYSAQRDGSRGYGGRKLIAFLLLVEKTAIVQENGDVIVMKDANYQLPVAEVTVQ
ncbi:hypothetical protein CLOM_g16483 [Closterium sp. NIES-68]|nr:hypothetical protein CLOM_g16483 [Closterium sp. NIES-68]GJP58191.1 hypothetical protein CLOP_g22664 [Closterium sp. NIES-67]